MRRAGMMARANASIYNRNNPLRLLHSMTTANSTDASPASTAQPHNGFSLISNEKLLDLYSTMVKCLLLETRISTLSKRTAASKAAVREEAAIAGAALDMLPGDTLAPSLNGYAAAFVKGLPVRSIFSIAVSGGGKSRSSYARLNLIKPSLSLAAQLERAMEAAAAIKKARNKRIVVAFCGKVGATPERLHDAMRQAGKRNLPVLFVCHSDAESDAFYQKAQEFDFPVVIVDGDDAVAVYRVATEAIAHARRGSGPTLIDCKPWVLAGGKPEKHDPIVRMEEYLTRKGLFDQKMKSKITAIFRREMAAAMMDSFPGAN
jgi:pyruvate dehydrogenase E1 component alpha subunit